MDCRIQRLSGVLAQKFPQGVPRNSFQRIRTTVLDTSCDDDTPLFHHPGHGHPLKKWKVWVD